MSSFGPKRKVRHLRVEESRLSY